MSTTVSEINLSDNVSARSAKWRLGYWEFETPAVPLYRFHPRNQTVDPSQTDYGQAGTVVASVAAVRASEGSHHRPSHLNTHHASPPKHNALGHSPPAQAHIHAHEASPFRVSPGPDPGMHLRQGQARNLGEDDELDAGSSRGTAVEAGLQAKPLSEMDPRDPKSPIHKRVIPSFLSNPIAIKPSN
eukprot:gene6882-30856_t